MNASVLVIDDSDDTRQLLELLLKKEDFYVISLSSGSEALQFLGHFIPDLLVIDLMMPGMDGLEFIQLIRNLPNHRHTPIVVLSAYTETYQEEAEKAGATKILKKPVDTLTLPEVLKSLLPQAGAGSAGTSR